ncbi:MAG: catalase [Rubritepida sp.]|nr:catalase [Rubritepida sp.]
MTARRTLLACLVVMPVAARAETNLGDELVDALEGAFGVHAGMRRVHAKGRLYDGRFLPLPAAAGVSTAPQFTAPTPIFLRFSDGPGIPNIPDGDPNALPPGLGLRFLTPGGAANDIVANADEGFPVRTGEDFALFLRAIAASGPSVAQPTPLESFVATHPETQRFLARPRQVPRSFGTTRYFGNNALVFLAADGVRRAFRYVIEPEPGLAAYTPEEARRQRPDFLYEDLAARLRQGPVRFGLVAQMAGAGDRTDDVTLLWPADRERLLLGTLEVTGEHPDQTAERELFLDPNNLPQGILLSDDPMLPARQQAYGVGISRRLAR